MRLMVRAVARPEQVSGVVGEEGAERTGHVCMSGPGGTAAGQPQLTHLVANERHQVLLGELLLGHGAGAHGLCGRAQVAERAERLDEMV